MSLSFASTRLSLKTARGLLYRVLILLWAFSLLGGTLCAQENSKEANQAEPARLIQEARQLYREGSKESLEKALQKLQQARTLFHSAKDVVGEARALQGSGRIYADLGEQRKALDDFASALTLYRAIGDKVGEAMILNNIAVVSQQLGETQKALENFNLVLPLFQASGDRVREATVLDNIGSAYYALGEKQKALDYFAQALTLRREIKDKSGEASTLGEIASVYEDVGEGQKALDYFTQSLALYHEVGYRRGEAAALNRIGLIYNSLGEKQKAIDFYTQALGIFVAVGDRKGQADTLNNAALVFKQTGEKKKALDYYTLALSLYRLLGYRPGEAVALNNIGSLYTDMGETQKALDNLAMALPLRRAVSDHEGEARTLYNIAYIQRGQGKLAEARANIEAAIAIIESLRTKIVNQEMRASYFATVQDYYKFYIDLLMQLHKQSPASGLDGEAFQTSERSRARVLLEMLTEANADIRQGVDPKLVLRERTLRQQLSAKAQEQMRLLSGTHTDEQAKQIAAEIDALTTEFQQVETQIKQSSPRYAALTQPQPLTLKEIQRDVLERDTILLEYSLSSKRSYLWAVTPDSITSYELPKREEIEASARRVYDIFNERNKAVEGETPEQRRARIAQADAQYAEAVAELSRKILVPVAKQLSNKRLLIVADGVLQYIPFAALTDPSINNEPLVVQHEIVNLPSASTLALLRRETKERRPAAKAVAVLADPVFEEDDERVKSTDNGTATAATNRPRRRLRSRRELPQGMERSLEESGLRDAGFEIPRLPGTRQEALKILSLVPPGEGKGAFDFAASRATATASELAQYRLIHFATHGFLNSLHPELSGIVLSMVDEQGKAQDGFLRTNDIFNLKLPAELVVLSACQTGLGKEIKGEGLVGLTRGFMYAGAPRVVVSLWSVSDAGTAELMTRFYSAMLKDKMRPAQALRAAQMSLLKERRWEQPFYWAAFTLQGEWR